METSLLFGGRFLRVGKAKWAVIPGRVKLIWEVSPADRCATWSDCQGSCQGTEKLYFDSVRQRWTFYPCQRPAEFLARIPGTERDVALCGDHGRRWISETFDRVSQRIVGLTIGATVIVIAGVWWLASWMG